MIDPDKNASLDQNATGIAEMWSTINWAMYRAHLAKGFSEERAFDLTREYLCCMIYRQAEQSSPRPPDEEE